MSTSGRQYFHEDGTMCHCDHDASGAETLTAIDPVCGMTVVKASAAHIATHEGRTYYFCSADCRSKFMDDPLAYVLSRAVEVEPAMTHDHHGEHPAHPHVR